MTAGLDLALAMVEEDLGPELARSAARTMVLYHRRSGDQSQHSALIELEPKSDRIQSALTYARSNLKNPLTLDELAEAARLSSRQFSRAFREETGQTPAKAVERLRVEAARLMLEEGRHTVETVAYETGFGDRERMRRAFLRNFGLPPHRPALGGTAVLRGRGRPSPQRPELRRLASIRRARAAARAVACRPPGQRKAGQSRQRSSTYSCSAIS
jgi:transcriptional regulator GlxA family with amidase domain